MITGKVGADLTVEEGAHAARVTGLNLLATLKAELDDLENVTSVLKLLGMVNVAPGFDDLPAVINGCSDLFVEVFGEKVGQPRALGGRDGRAAVRDGGRDRGRRRGALAVL